MYSILKNIHLGIRIYFIYIYALGYIEENITIFFLVPKPFRLIFSMFPSPLVVNEYHDYNMLGYHT